MAVLILVYNCQDLTLIPICVQVRFLHFSIDLEKHHCRSNEIFIIWARGNDMADIRINK